METKFKVGDKIRITKTSFEAKKRYQVGDIKTIIGENRQGFVVDSNWQHECPAYIGNHETVNPCYKCEWELVEEKPRFHNAQPEDLLWNDELGICRIINIMPSLPHGVKIECEMCIDVITFDGKRYEDSPKATFFYYTPENHYLTERPEIDVDWANVEEGTNIVVKSPNGSEFNKLFYAYLLDKAFPIVTKDNINGLQEWKKARLING